MSGPVIQGWCPGALRPMQSGDGLVVRVRPHGGRLTAAQAAAIAAASAQHGNGLIDLSARGNVQLRGVQAETHDALIADLRAVGLIDADLAQETRRNILVAPLWTPGDGVQEIAAALEAALAEAPALPGKFGFAIDIGPGPVLQDCSADIRLERSAEGGLILRAEGLGTGTPVGLADAAHEAVRLARWFVDSGGVQDGRGRMAALIKGGARPAGLQAGGRPPAPPRPVPGPGLTAWGALVGFEFGQLTADTLAALAPLGPAIRVTPWRMLLIEGLTALPRLGGLITDPGDPLRRVVACTGAPGCPQALGSTRPLARALAAHLTAAPELLPEGGLLHVSGCAKGCAHPGPAALTLTATATGYDLIHHGTARDPAIRRGLSAAALTATPDLFLKAPDAP
jgi:precorrin-3B synthase